MTTHNKRRDLDEPQITCPTLIGKAVDPHNTIPLMRVGHMHNHSFDQSPIIITFFFPIKRNQILILFFLILDEYNLLEMGKDLIPKKYDLKLIWNSS